MNKQARKLEIIERVLHLESDEALATVEQVLEMLEISIPGEGEIPIMPLRSKQEIAARLEQARADVQTGQTLTHEELVARTQQWHRA